MAQHRFYPPVELPTQVQSYVEGLKNHKADYGEVPQNTPADLKGIYAEAGRLEPMAQEIHDLELALAAKQEAYYKAARPLWDAFSEKLGYAKVYAQKHEKDALLAFLRNYQHHTRSHAAAASAQAAAPADTHPTP